MNYSQTLVFAAVNELTIALLSLPAFREASQPDADRAITTLGEKVRKNMVPLVEQPQSRQEMSLAWAKAASLRALFLATAMLGLLIAAAKPGQCQANFDPVDFFRQNIGLTQSEISSIQSGSPVAKSLPARTPAEVYLFGAVYIRSTPEHYFQYATDFNQLRKLPIYLGLGTFSNPPQLSDLKGFSLDSDDIQSLRNCTSGNCMIQMPASSIEELHQSINWGSPQAGDEVNQLLQKTALQGLLAYQSAGDAALRTYNDQASATQVGQQFAFILGYDKTLQQQIPGFYNYLLSYPSAKPANVEDVFYWANVKFGLKPTLRIVQRVTLRGDPGSHVLYVIADKQLYASHYFETALDLSFCVRGKDNPTPDGFYLIMVMGSEQTGLTGIKGSIIRRVAVDRSVTNLQDSLNTLRYALEGQH